MYENNKKERKKVCVNLPIEIYEQLEKKARRRRLDKTNYISYLIQKDKDDIYSEGASNALDQISCSTEKLLQSIGKDDKIRPFVIDIRDGVNDLWRYLR